MTYKHRGKVVTGQVRFPKGSTVCWGNVPKREGYVTGMPFVAWKRHESDTMHTTKRIALFVSEDDAEAFCQMMEATR